MKRIVKYHFLFLIALVSFVANASVPDSIGVKKENGKTFIIHRIGKGEGWMSIAQTYGISYAELRLANKKHSDKLESGKTILIPADKLKVNDPHFGKNTIQGKEINYTVKQGETLFAIAQQFETSVDSLSKWNHLSTSAVKPGQQLIVRNKTSVQKKEPEALQTKTIKTAGQLRPDTTHVVSTASTDKTAKAKKSVADVVAKGRKEVFENGVAAWIQDDDVNPSKYYALHRTASIGTIIKVTNKMNNKYVFVKVVGVLPDTGDNTDLIIKISKASAEKLGVHDSKFQSELNYGVSEKL